MKLLLFKNFKYPKIYKDLLRACCTKSYTNLEEKDLTNSLKREIESHWKDKINKGTFKVKDAKNKFYVLSMFPYPSGSLHMGHVRVYAISDAMARFYRMNGKNVFHPIGWDAFGLPAENAAIERKVEPAEWTKQNIEQMKEQLGRLGCSFDWPHELSTCDESYYKWTQQLFLMMYEKGLVYQNEALVNWDPVDKTVLADEQVDEQGHSWRSGAKVQKKLLKQWFIRTTKFANNLLEGLSDPTLQDWRDIINLQKHWIGDCNGYVFNLPVINDNNLSVNTIRIWTQYPEYLLDTNAFLILKSSHYLNAMNKDQEKELKVYNDFSKNLMQIIFYDDIEFPDHCDIYLAAPSYNDYDKDLSKLLKVDCDFENFTPINERNPRKQVLLQAQENQLGGYEVSSKLQDWLISRQRFWGTPIPIVHCDKCGAVPVKYDQLPVCLPSKREYLEKDEHLYKTHCPKCNDPSARRELDTMDTFVDSSWYYLRYLDSKNNDKIFDESLIKQCMPVDLYIGGKEHAVLHLYYARFMNHFLHSLGLVPCSEPFKRLLVQGMVMGRSFRVKGSGKYLKGHEVKIIDAKKNKAIEKETGEQVIVTWEKMSKSKLNGVDPSEIISEYGSDTTRLIILGDVAPTSHRNWSTATFPGILNWQKRLWLTIGDFCKIRNAPDDKLTQINKDFDTEDEKLYDSRNYYIKGATFNYRHTYQLSIAISKMQGLTNSIRRAPKNVIKYGRQFERALASQIIMLAPMAPHFASELWAKFVQSEGRVNDDSEEIQWNSDVLNQRWPEVDMEYNLELTIKINGFENAIIKLPRRQMDKVTCNDAMDIAFNTESVTSYVAGKKIRTTNFVNYPGCEAILNIYLDKIGKSKNSELEQKISNK